MHILIVNHHQLDTPGGSETQCHEIALRLVKLGHTVTYAVCRPGRQTYDVPYRTHPLRGSLPAAFSAALTALAPDVVYWRRNKRYLLRSVLAARRQGVRFVFAVSSILDVRPFSKRQFLAEDFNASRRARRVFAQLRSAARGLVNYFALPLVDGIVFQHSGQLPHGFHGRHAIIYNSYPQLDVPSAPSSVPYVLWVGSLKKIKNPEYFLRLASDLQATGVEFLMAGAVQDPAYQRLLSKESALPSNFRYLGLKSQDAINSLMRGSLFIVSTSTDEGFPNVFVQTWLQRRTVVSLYVDPGGLLETEQLGLCSGSYTAFRDDVSRLVADPVLRHTMGERGYQFAIANCNPDVNVRQLENFLSRTVSGEH